MESHGLQGAESCQEDLALVCLLFPCIPKSRESTAGSAMSTVN